MPHPDFEKPLTYLHQKTAGQRLACRADIVPAELKGILPDVAFMTPIFDDDGEVCDASVQLEGTRVASFFGEYTGKGVRTEFDLVIANRIIAAVTACIKVRKPIITEAIASLPNDRKAIARGLYVPLSEDGKGIDRVFVYFRVNTSI